MACARLVLVYNIFDALVIRKVPENINELEGPLLCPLSKQKKPRRFGPGVFISA
jgi:hypothetical protein